MGKSNNYWHRKEHANLSRSISELKEGQDKIYATVQELSARLEAVCNQSELHTHYILLSKKQVWAVVASALGGLGSVVYALLQKLGIL